MNLPQERPEIVIGLVYAAGTDIEPVCETLTEVLAGLAYDTKAIHLSKGLREILYPDQPPAEPKTYDADLRSRMEEGNRWREMLGRGDAMALLALTAIRHTRKVDQDDVDRAAVTPLPSTAFLIRSLKNPKEVETLREVYGPSFFLISVYEPRLQRERNLARLIAGTHLDTQVDRYRSTAAGLIDRDDAEDGKKLGQQVRKTFWQGDAFITVGQAEHLTKQCRRVLDIWFGHPFHTPTKDEYLMFSAQAAAYLSASLGRQVGAVIATADGSILSTGSNEVPQAGGGPYWSDDENDQRDHILGYDSSDRMRGILLQEIVQNILHKLKESESLVEGLSSLTVEQLAETLISEGIGSTHISNLTEYQRPVHAEMMALTDAAKRGIAVKGCTLYSTTFPCHGCTRHLIASGISRVVYIEPYVKSLAQNLHEDAISLDNERCTDGRVRFEPFVGVAPRRYMELFAMKKRKEDDGKALKWEPRAAFPHLNGWHHLLTFENENKTLVKLDQEIQDDTSTSEEEEQT